MKIKEILARLFNRQQMNEQEKGGKRHKENI
jgi:hypothetical protein